MYKNLIRPLLFLLEPENAHRFAARSIKVINCLPGFHWVAKKMFNTDTPNSGIEHCGLPFRNRVGLAAGFDKNADLYKDFALFGFSFIEIGTVTPLPQPGNPKPRLFRIKKDRAMVNRMGFNNGGVLEAAERLKGSHKVLIGGNIGKNKVTPNEEAESDYLYCLRELYPYVDYFVVNVSSPNTFGLRRLQSRQALTALLRHVEAERRSISISPDRKVPVLVKLSPDLTDQELDDALDAILSAGVEGVIATNTTIRRDSLKSPKASEDGGLSGAPLRTRSTQVVRKIYARTNGRLPIVGVGGVMNPAGAQEKLDAGAALVQLFSGLVYGGPGVVQKILKAL